ncbi:hypothetical protein BH11PSE3_BH11PSE3_22190 [soil metagenome]
MFSNFDEREDAPRDIARFEGAWLVAMVLSVVIAISMYDYTIEMIGPFPAALANITLFCLSAVLMVYASRRRSNVARLLLLPFLLLILVYDVSHFGQMEGIGITRYFTFGQLGTMLAGVYFLFTPSSRAWYGGRPMPPDPVD